MAWWLVPCALNSGSSGNGGQCVSYRGVGVTLRWDSIPSRKEFRDAPRPYMVWKSAMGDGPLGHWV